MGKKRCKAAARTIAKIMSKSQSPKILMPTLDT